MRTKTFLIILFLGAWLPAGAQLTLEECYRQARANYPLIRQYGLIEKTREYNLENAARGYLPQLAFSAQATYQSDVTRIPIDLDALGFTGVEIPTLSQDQYKAELSLNQTIWDGGAIRSRRSSIRTQAEVEQRDLDVSLYALRDRVNQLYFGILLSDARLRQSRVLQDELRRHLDQVASYINNGIGRGAAPPRPPRLCGDALPLHRAGASRRRDAGKALRRPPQCFAEPTPGVSSL